MSIAFGLVFLVGIVIAGSFILVRALSSKNQSVGADLVAYGLLGIFVGGTVWSLILLARAAFPDQGLIGQGSQAELAGALAGIIVAAPISYILWKRQDERRSQFPDSSGWSVYLAITDAIYLTWAVVYAVLLLFALLGDGDFPRMTDLVIIFGVVALHEWASRVDQPGGNISQIHRVVGSFIGLSTLSAGVGWILFWIFERIYSSFTATAGSSQLAIGVSMTVVGALVWAVRWLTPWRQAADGTKFTYLVLVVTGSFVTMVAAATSLGILIVVYVLDRPDTPGQHFESTPAILAVLITAALVWMHHRPGFGPQRNDAERAYQYLTAAIGLGTAITAGVVLARILVTNDSLIDNVAAAGISLVIVLAVGAVIWWLFWSEAQEAPRVEEASSLPRKFYVIGLAVILGLVTAGAVVGVLLYVFQSLFSLDPQPSTLVTELTLALLAGGMTFHLITQNRADSELRDEPGSRPYVLTVICSHPGSLASKLPKEASLRIIHRGDEIGFITEEMATTIAEQTVGFDSIVWVDEDTFKSVPALHN